MAFTNKNLSVIAYANGFTLWQYSTTEALSAITNYYFVAVKNMMATNDLIILCCSDGVSIKRLTITTSQITLGALV